MGRTSKSYLPRLPREFYQGDAVAHWTLTLEGRTKGWLNPELHLRFRELSLHVAAREGLLCPTYVLMPDHIHLFWMGLRHESDQLNGMAFLRTHLEPLLAPAVFQHQAHDHRLKVEERRKGAFAKTCFYILNNPAKAELVGQPADWEYSGAVVAGYPKLHPLEPHYWDRFWGICAKLRSADAGDRMLPAIHES